MVGVFYSLLLLYVLVMEETNINTGKSRNRTDKSRKDRKKKRIGFTGIRRWEWW